MNKIQHPSNNGVLGAPKGWEQGKIPCSALAVTHTEVDGAPCVVSYWRPTEQELAELNAGHFVTLHVIGYTMPPVAVGVAQ